MAVAGVRIVPLVLFLAFLGFLGLGGCAGDGSDTPRGNGNGGGNGECDPPDDPVISFSQNIAPLWGTRCAIPSCHDASSPQSPNLEPSVSYANTVNVASTQLPALDLV
jgi:hypothetical protein